MTATFRMAGREIARVGFGAMRLRASASDYRAAIPVLRRAVELGVDHIDTAAYYGPGTANRAIRAALYPYPESLLIATKVGWTLEGGRLRPAGTPEDLVAGVDANLRTLGVDSLDLVNLRLDDTAHADLRTLERPIETLCRLQRDGKIRHIGISNASTAQVRYACTLTPIAQVQNLYNLGNIGDDELIRELAESGIAYVPFCPLLSVPPSAEARIAADMRETGLPRSAVILGRMLAEHPNLLVIPGTGSVSHLEENVRAREFPGV